MLQVNVPYNRSGVQANGLTGTFYHNTKKDNNLQIMPKTEL